MSEITGKIVYVLPEQTLNGKNGEIRKHGFVIETSGEYPKKVAFDVLDSGDKDKWGKMQEHVVVGNSVSVSFEVSSREWQGRWFTQANAFRVTSLSGAGTTASGSSSPTPAPVSAPTTQDNDVPF